MAVANDLSLTYTRDQLISAALRIVGAIDQETPATTTQISQAAEALNLMVAAWQTDGLQLWARKQVSIPLVQGQASYTIGLGQSVNVAKPLKIYQSILHDNLSANDLPMQVIPFADYENLGNKTAQGTPVQVVYTPDETFGTLYVYPTPDSYTAGNRVINLTYQRPFAEFDLSTDTPDFPVEWYEAIKFGLAARIAPEYGIPITERTRLAQEAEAIKQQAMSFGQEDSSIFFQPWRE